MSSGVSRRGFLKATGVGVAISKTLLPMTSLISAQNQADAFKEVLGKDQRMIVHNWRPGVLETPLELLRQHRVTPKELLFVRNNQVPDNALSIKPLPLEGWIIEVIGLVKYPRRVRAEDLTSYQQTEVEMVLQCSGNGRAYYASGVRTRGTQWQKGGVGNVRWGGVPVRVLVEQLKLEVDPAARFITAEGSDSPAAEAADFEHSLPLEGRSRPGNSGLKDEWRAHPGHSWRTSPAHHTRILWHHEHQMAQPTALWSSRNQQLQSYAPVSDLQSTYPAGYKSAFYIQQ